MSPASGCFPYDYRLETRPSEHSWNIAVWTLEKLPQLTGKIAALTDKAEARLPGLDPVVGAEFSVVCALQLVLLGLHGLGWRRQCA